MGDHDVSSGSCYGKRDRMLFTEHFEAELRAEILAAKLKEMRLKRKMTQEQLARLVGKDKTQISKIEQGRNLTIATIVQLVEALGGKIRFDIDFA